MARRRARMGPATTDASLLLTSRWMQRQVALRERAGRFAAPAPQAGRSRRSWRRACACVDKIRCCMPSALSEGPQQGCAAACSQHLAAADCRFGMFTVK